jgi:guanylate kinase
MRLDSIFSKKAVDDVARTGRICVLDVDKQGVKNIRKTDLHPLFIYISPPSFEILEKRLRARKTDTESAIDKRLKEAKESMEFSRQPGVYDHIVLNDQLDEAYKNFKAVLRPVTMNRRRRKETSFFHFSFRTSRKCCNSKRNNDSMYSPLF